MEAQKPKARSLRDTATQTGVRQDTYKIVQIENEVTKDAKIKGKKRRIVETLPQSTLTMVFVAFLNKYIHVRRSLRSYMNELAAVNMGSATGNKSEQNSTNRFGGSSSFHVDRGLVTPSRQQHTNNKNRATGSSIINTNNTKSGLTAEEILRLEEELRTLSMNVAVTSTPNTEPKPVRATRSPADEDGDGDEEINDDREYTCDDEVGSIKKENDTQQFSAEGKSQLYSGEKNAVTPPACRPVTVGRFAYRGGRSKRAAGPASPTFMRSGNDDDDADIASPVSAGTKRALSQINPNISSYSSCGRQPSVSSSVVRTQPRRWRVNQKPVETLSTDEVAVALLSKFAC